MRPDKDALVINALGHRCPTPTLRLRRAMERAGAGARLTLICDDPMARVDVPHFLASAEADLIEILEAEGVLTFMVAVR